MGREAPLIPVPLAKFAVPVGTKSLAKPGSVGEPSYSNQDSPLAGLLIMNADDWGRDHETTDQTLECIGHGSVSSVSAMVFMADSVRAAAIARERGIDTGLHLNFTTPFSAPDCPPRLMECQRELAKCLLRHRLSQVLFYPSLMRSFEYVVSAQNEEFCRLYGAPPGRFDGHHHMHLCANVLLGRLLPPGTVVRRNFSFQPGEKSFVNRLYRQVVDFVLARRHRLVDYFFCLPPLDSPGRLERIFELATAFVVEVETHSACPDEYNFLMGDQILSLTTNVRLGAPTAISKRDTANA